MKCKKWIIISLSGWNLVENTLLNHQGRANDSLAQGGGLLQRRAYHSHPWSESASRRKDLAMNHNINHYCRNKKCWVYQSGSFYWELVPDAWRWLCWVWCWWWLYGAGMQGRTVRCPLCLMEWCPPPSAVPAPSLPRRWVDLVFSKNTALRRYRAGQKFGVGKIQKKKKKFSKQVS